MLVIVFDRVFQRDDVMIEVVIHPIDHAGQRGRFAAAGRAGDQKQTARAFEQIDNDRRQANLLERQKFVGDPPQDNADMAALFEDRYAKTRLFAESETKVGPAHFLKFLLVALGRDALHQSDGILRFENLRIELQHPPTLSHDRWLARSNVQVAYVLLDHCLQQFVNLK